MATATPWGPADSKETLARGINRYGTPSHGGYKISPTKLAAMPAGLAKIGFAWGGGTWFEEDCAWSAVALAFPDLFTGSGVEEAHATCKNYFPNGYSEAFGVKVEGFESCAIRERVAEAKYWNCYTARSVVGDWHEDCPTGKILIHAKRNSDGDTKSFIIPEDDYKGGHFVLDPEIHAEV